jgi:hypothetical protein
MRNLSVSHDRSEETIEAKVRWFRSLSPEERMDVFCEFTDLILAVNPCVAEKERARPVEGRIRVLSAT